MTRQEIYREVKEMLGVVPTMFKTIPDEQLELEWKLFRASQMDEGAVPNKYRELIGLGLSAVKGCPYCTFFHTEMAKLSGATDQEIEEAVHYAKSSAGWSAYLHGMQVDLGKFKAEVRQACEYVRAAHAAPR